MESGKSPLTQDLLLSKQGRQRIKFKAEPGEKIGVRENNLFGLQMLSHLDKKPSGRSQKVKDMGEEVTDRWVQTDLGHTVAEGR